jgi:hypothetical protein
LFILEQKGILFQRQTMPEGTGGIVWTDVLRKRLTKRNLGITCTVREVAPMESEGRRRDENRVFGRVIVYQGLLKRKLEWLGIFEESGVLAWSKAVTKGARGVVWAFVLSEGFAERGRRVD